MFSVLAALIATYYVAAVVQTVGHRLYGHSGRIGAIYLAHTHGHHGAYPRTALLQSAWLEPQSNALWYYAPPLALIGLAVWWAAPLPILVAYLAGLVFSITLHVGLHRHYHLQGSVLERFCWFRRKRELHFIHHRQVRCNFAIIEFWLDRLLGTYRPP